MPAIHPPNLEYPLTIRLTDGNKNSKSLRRREKNCCQKRKKVCFFIHTFAGVNSMSFVALRSLKDLEKKHLNLQEQHEHLETELFEKNEEFTKLSTASKNLYKEYETLKNQYETETGAMARYVYISYVKKIDFTIINYHKLN